MAVADLFKHGFHNLYKFKDVNHVCQLSQEAILSAVAAEEVGPGSDDEGPGECCQLSIASDPLRLQAVFDVAREAISRSTPLPLPAEPLRRDAAHWLVAQELASHTSDGGLVLLSDAMQSMTELAGPELVKHPEVNADNSAWGLRQKLEQEGWTAGKASSACASGKIFNAKNATKSYYCILLD